MKKLLVIMALMATPAAAESNAPATIVCAFQTGESFTVVGQGGTTMIQWGTNAFRSAASAFDTAAYRVAFCR